MKGLWEEKARRERGKEGTDPRLESYASLLSATYGDPQLEAILKKVEEKALAYASTVKNLQSSRAGLSEGRDRGDVEKYDSFRRSAHNALIDEINLLSRQCREAGRSNKWRQEIGLSRDEAGEWAIHLAEYLKKIGTKPEED